MNIGHTQLVIPDGIEDNVDVSDDMMQWGRSF